VLTHLSIRATALPTLPHQKSPLIPLNSHSCAQSRSNSPRITLLRKTTPGVVPPSLPARSRRRFKSSRIPTFQINVKTNNFKSSRMTTLRKTGGVSRSPSLNLQPSNLQPANPRFSSLQTCQRSNALAMCRPYVSSVCIMRPNFRSTRQPHATTHKTGERTWQPHPKLGNRHQSAFSAP
jgi:hypothetical protein